MTYPRGLCNMLSNEFLEKRFAKNPDIAFQEVVDEIVLIFIRPEIKHIENIYTLNNVAGRVWQLVDGHKNVAQIRDTIVREFDVLPEDAEADLVAFLSQLELTGAITAV
jgi:hypothetical protein